MKISYTSYNSKTPISKLKNILLISVFLDHLKQLHKLNYASLKLTATILLIGNTVFSQKAINGIVKDSLNIPITGATVVLKGKNVFAISPNFFLFLGPCVSRGEPCVASCRPS